MDAPDPQARPGVFVVVPALNEEAALPLVLAELPRERVNAIVVVDNGSTDRTAEVARAAGALVVHEPLRGYGRACLRGLRALRESPSGGLPDDAIVVFLDGDHSDFPADLPRLLEPIQSGRADFVVGSRVRGGASLRALLPQAWVGNRLACAMLRVLFGLRCSDLGPFRAIRADALAHLCMRDEGFGWTIEMQLKAHAAHLRVAEIPVRYRPRIGRSKITGTVRGSVLAAGKIFAWIVGWRLATLTGRRGIPRYR
jgi:glycosyltransferase involved in cell wall biosynthesis